MLHFYKSCNLLQPPFRWVLFFFLRVKQDSQVKKWLYCFLSRFPPWLCTYRWGKWLTWSNFCFCHFLPFCYDPPHSTIWCTLIRLRSMAFACVIRSGDRPDCYLNCLSFATILHQTSSDLLSQSSSSLFLLVLYLWNHANPRQVRIGESRFYCPCIEMAFQPSSSL